MYVGLVALSFLSLIFLLFAQSKNVKNDVLFANPFYSTLYLYTALPLSSSEVLLSGLLLCYKMLKSSKTWKALSLNEQFRLPPLTLNQNVVINILWCVFFFFHHPIDIAVGWPFLWHAGFKLFETVAYCLMFSSIPQVRVCAKRWERKRKEKISSTALK